MYTRRKCAACLWCLEINMHVISFYTSSVLVVSHCIRCAFCWRGKGAKFTWCACQLTTKNHKTFHGLVRKLCCTCRIVDRENCLYIRSHKSSHVTVGKSEAHLQSRPSNLHSFWRWCRWIEIQCFVLSWIWRALFMSKPNSFGENHRRKCSYRNTKNFYFAKLWFERVLWNSLINPQNLGRLALGISLKIKGASVLATL